MVMKAQFLMDYTRSFYINDFNAALDHVIPERTVLNLSSVIHEVYSYSKNDEEIGLFWHNVTCSGFKYIVIRDFCLSESAKRNSNIIDLMKLKMKCDKKQLREFEGVWGSVRKNQNLVHYLMKYRYLENWNREVKENYFPVSAEKIKDSFRKSYYEPIYMQEYTLPFTRDKVKEDFGIKLKDFTHVKMIFERKY